MKDFHIGIVVMTDGTNGDSGKEKCYSDKVCEREEELQQQVDSFNSTSHGFGFSLRQRLVKRWRVSAGKEYYAEWKGNKYIEGYDKISKLLEMLNAGKISEDSLPDKL